MRAGLEAGRQGLLRVSCDGHAELGRHRSVHTLSVVGEVLHNAAVRAPSCPGTQRWLVVVHQEHRSSALPNRYR